MGTYATRRGTRLSAAATELKRAQEPPAPLHRPALNPPAAAGLDRAPRPTLQYVACMKRQPPQQLFPRRRRCHRLPTPPAALSRFARRLPLCQALSEPPQPGPWPAERPGRDEVCGPPQGHIPGPDRTRNRAAKALFEAENAPQIPRWQRLHVHRQILGRDNAAPPSHRPVAIAPISSGTPQRS